MVLFAYYRWLPQSMARSQMEAMVMGSVCSRLRVCMFSNSSHIHRHTGSRHEIGDKLVLSNKPA